MQSSLLFLLNSAVGPASPVGRGAAGGMMHGGPGGFLLGGLMSVLWTVLIVLAVLWVTRNWSTITSYSRRAAASLQPGSSPAAAQAPLEILQTRYAKGEINREEYEAIRRDLAGEPAPTPTAEPVTAQA
jgi:putative membrane protein